MNIDDYKPTEADIKLLIKGPPGTRKTTQAATFPGPIFWFDLDRKLGESISLPRSYVLFHMILILNMNNLHLGIMLRKD